MNSDIWRESLRQVVFVARNASIPHYVILPLHSEYDSSGCLSALKEESVYFLLVYEAGAKKNASISHDL